eukprot:CAMPEP_0180260336 /NCGR_PEP_ID=MMETSP0987-20121128/43532_1 /TAXON_ID=697907 /ORGANISM="non described non described, Strain CCMP2293" /LENGTH=119 /DNA_ID=CAMNT_0022230169 /DNA_START=45 /DNA_END=401 /DNA_ORIENTATION=-
MSISFSERSPRSSTIDLARTARDANSVSRATSSHVASSGTTSAGDQAAEAAGARPRSPSSERSPACTSAINLHGAGVWTAATSAAGNRGSTLSASALGKHSSANLLTKSATITHSSGSS